MTQFRIYEWREYPTEPEEGAAYLPNPYYAGFRVKLLVNPTKGEVRQEHQVFTALKEGTATEEDWYRVVAPRIVEWTLEGIDADGNVHRLEAPGENPDNWTAFDDIPPDVTWWLVDQIRYAHLPKRNPATETMTPIPSLASVGPTAGSTPTPNDREPTPLRPSRKRRSSS